MLAYEEEIRVFDRLNASGSPIAAAVAFSFYTQAKRDWVAQFRAENRRYPTDDELMSFVRAHGSILLDTLLDHGRGIIIHVIRRGIASVRPSIVAEALRGGFWRAFWPSFVATVAFSLALAAVAFSPALLGFGLPVAISVARG